MPYESSWTRSYAYDLTDYDEWSGRRWLPATERSRILFYPARIVVATLAIVFLSSPNQDNRSSSITSGRLLLLHFLVDLVACFFFHSWRFGTITAFLGTPSFACSPWTIDWF
jgi:hypothetical protein